MIAIIY